MVLATIIIAFYSMVVWAHHMFATGAVLLPFFSATTFIIAVPTGIKFFTWIGTMWRGSISFETAMLFAIGFMVTFLLGISTLPFLWNVFRSCRFGEVTTAEDPWGHGNSLEWATPTPPPRRHNFVSMPRIRSERPAFEKHYPALRERLEREPHFGRPKEALLPPPRPERGERRGDPATDPSAG